MSDCSLPNDAYHNNVRSRHIDYYNTKAVHDDDTVSRKWNLIYFTFQK